MAKSISIKKPEVKELDENKKVADWRRDIFREIMIKAGISESEIMGDDLESLVRSRATWKQVQELSEAKCPPGLIAKILS